MKTATIPNDVLAARARRRAVLLLALCAAGGVRAQAVAERPRESSVKAAFLHKFASFVEWPDGTFPRGDTPLRIGIYGDDQVWRELRDLARDRDRDGRPVQVNRIGVGDALAGHHIVYLRASSAGRLNEALAQVPEGVLTVVDSDGLHPRASVLSFFTEEGRVRFGVSIEAAGRQKLRLSSRLLSVAKNVQSRGNKDGTPPDMMLA